MNGAFQAVFLDRDGTIGGSDQIEYPGDFKLFHFTEEVIQTLKFHNISVFLSLISLESVVVMHA